MPPERGEAPHNDWGSYILEYVRGSLLITDALLGYFQCDINRRICGDSDHNVTLITIPADHCLHRSTDVTIAIGHTGHRMGIRKVPGWPMLQMLNNGEIGWKSQEKLQRARPVPRLGIMESIRRAQADSYDPYPGCSPWPGIPIHRHPLFSLLCSAHPLGFLHKPPPQPPSFPPPCICCCLSSRGRQAQQPELAATFTRGQSPIDSLRPQHKTGEQHARRERARWGEG